MEERTKVEMFKWKEIKLVFSLNTESLSRDSVFRGKKFPAHLKKTQRLSCVMNKKRKCLAHAY